MKDTLTDKEKIEIVELYNKGLSTVEIGKIYNRKRQNIRDLLARRGIKMRQKSYYRNYDIDLRFFEKIDSKEKAQILGFLYADGYNSEERGMIRVSLHHQDREYLEFILKEMKSNIPIKTHKANIKQGNPNDKVSITIDSKKMSQDLAKLGCMQAKSLILKFPNCKIIPSKFINSFVLGYFEGDGCFSRDNRKKCCIKMSICGTKEFLETLSKIFKKKFNIECLMYKNCKNDVNAYVLWVGGNFNVLSICGWMYNNSAFTMERKSKFRKELIEFCKNWDMEREKTRERYKKIKTEFENGLSRKELVKKYDLSYNTIYAITRFGYNKKWESSNKHS